MAAIAGGEGEEQAAKLEAAVMNTDEEKPQDVSNKKPSSIVALLEEVNTKRKEQLNDSVNDSNEMKDTSAIMPGAVANGTVELGTNTHVPDAPESKSGRSAYSAETVAAISSLASGRSPLFYDDVNGSGESNSAVGQKSASSSVKKAALSKKEITLQDRASAVMSVYKDYLDEVKDENDSASQSENNEADMVTDDDELLVPFHTVKHRPLNMHERRKEGHKVAVLDKFCKDVEEGNISATSENYFDDSDEDKSSKQGSQSSKSSKKKRFSNHPTAASTTAAFRLKAEVALKAAATKTKTVATNAAVAVKTKYKDKTTTSAQLLEKIGVDNDYDFADYHGEDSRILPSKNKTNEEMEYGLPPTSQNENIVDSGFYGLHMLQRDDEIKSLKRKGRIDREEMESMQRFNDMCDELGVTPQSHSNLHYFYQQQRSRYQYPFFRSKKCKRAILYGAICFGLAVIVVSLTSAITNGFEDVRRKSAKPLPDWKEDEDWRESVKETWEKDHAVSEGITMPESPSSSTPETADDAIAYANQLKQLFSEVSAAFRPILYDRSTGWQGRTYQEAVTWCDAYHNYIPCPFEVYCPDQKHLMPEIEDQEGESWAPVVNQENEWVQVGTGDICELYSEKFGTKPEWGVSGANSEAITGHIMCCRAHGLRPDEESQNQPDQYVDKATNPPLPPPDEESELDGSMNQSDVADETGSDVGDFGGTELDFEMLEVKLTQQFFPTWFDRQTGWFGQTYEQSKEFCSHIEGFMLCPHYVYCPGGGKKVLGGRKDEGESWAAVIDGFNEWVQVGAGGECNLYSASEGESPDWGLTGNNNEEITRHIMCCKNPKENVDSVSEESVSEESVADTVKEDSVTETADIETEETNAKENDSSSVVQNDSGNVAHNENESSSMSMLEIVTENEFHPEWFDSRLGWLGGTYDEAKAFCESLPQPDNGHWYLCPRHAYCPNGPRDNEPLYLQKDAFEGIQWAPISDRQNGWVLVGKMSQQLPHTCEEYFQINHHDPLWGLDGSSTDMKKHILCCNAPSGIDLFEGDEQENKLPAKPNHDDSVLLGTFTPRWFSEADGWNSGSHDDAIAFCEQHDGIHHNGKKMELCPYVAYCPQGPGTQPIRGHKIDVKEEGQQWAPLYGNENHWVSISGEKTCLSHREVNREEPSWGLDASQPELKKHVLCCSPRQ